MPDGAGDGTGYRAGDGATTGANQTTTGPTGVRMRQRRRFWHHLAWSAAGSTLLAAAVFLFSGMFWPTLSFFALMITMSVFFAAYYALLRIE